MHTIYYADEVRSIDEIDRATNEAAKESELALAERLIGELTSKKIDLSKYHDTFREKVEEAAQQKIAGQQVTEAHEEPRRGQVIDLMAALKASLEKRGAPPEERVAERAAESRRRSRRGSRSGQGDRHGRRQDARPRDSRGRRRAPPRRRQKVARPACAARTRRACRSRVGAPRPDGPRVPGRGDAATNDQAAGAARLKARGPRRFPQARPLARKNQ